ncbi:GNAT superfamily N-acetyltransferase [Streptomyces pristinaespiralis]|uniref:GNAT family N-acetyltransferase n=1 Tax=Streptomyces pristinaespiralis TaxID=38300 RepID=A0A0M3QGV3_STRPR|nr:hypothetical protein SPRI_0147 [Streptomyces pristinaespiralis]ALC25512.1 hypothetical protein SPRI_7206 [Streptomyces pristinaespiralis]
MSSSTVPVVPARVGRPASRADSDVLAALLADAFFDDPLTRWIVPDDGRRAAVLPGFFRVFLSMSFAFDAVRTTAGRDAVMTFLPPGGWEEVERHHDAYGRQFAEVLGEDAARLSVISALQAEHHPVGRPHYYLAFGAVSPRARGAGVLSSLVGEVTSWADARGVGVYAEASSPGGRAACLRHGFTPAGPALTLPDGGPSLEPLWRDPR